jgi:simple sugar transport system permease protein
VSTNASLGVPVEGWHPGRISHLFRALLRRPELAPLAGVVLVFSFFAMTAGDSGFLTSQGTLNYLEVAAQLGIVTVAVTLLAIAGEFDLSVGSMIGFAGMLVAIPVALHGWPLWAAILMTLAVAAAIGFLNGIVTVKTGLPSFIVTLAGLFILRGLTIWLTHSATDGGTSVTGLREASGDDPLLDLFTGKLFGIPASVYWWIALVAIGSWVLARVRMGNWILGTGGDAESSRRLGVPVARVKIMLFVGTAMAAAIVGMIITLTAGQSDTQSGTLKEFQAITATVIGGTLLTGGYGTVIGGALGALVFGIVSQGIFFTAVDTDLFQVFLGGMLLAAVLFNHFIRGRAMRGGTR